MRGRVLAGVAGLAMLLASQAAAEPRRIALVLGNAAYARDLFAPLPNARNDMEGMGAALKGLGFQTLTQLDLTKGGFDKELQAFAAQISPGDAVIVFYAGHGVMGPAGAGLEAIDNYLVPVEADLSSMTATPPSALGLGQVLAALEKAQAGPRIIIIDACRQNLAGLKATPAAGEGPVTGPVSRSRPRPRCTRCFWPSPPRRQTGAGCGRLRAQWPLHGRDPAPTGRARSDGGPAVRGSLDRGRPRQRG